MLLWEVYHPEANILPHVKVVTLMGRMLDRYADS